MDSEFVFKLLNCVGPFDRLGLLVEIHEKVSNGLFQVLDIDKVIGLEQLALQDTEPDLQLIEPGGIRRQPTDVKLELTLHHCWLFLQPAFQLLRSVGGSIVQDQADRPCTALKRLRDDDLLHKGLKIGKGFARAAAARDLPIGDTESRKQVPGATTLSDHWFRRSWQCVGSPSPDAHGWLTRSALAPRVPGPSNVLGRGDASLSLPSCSTRSDSLVWVLSSCVPPNPTGSLWTKEFDSL